MIAMDSNVTKEMQLSIIEKGYWLINLQLVARNRLLLINISSEVKMPLMNLNIFAGLFL